MYIQYQQLNGKGDLLEYLKQFLIPICLHYSTTFPCCKEVPREFQLKIQSWGPVKNMINIF